MPSPKVLTAPPFIMLYYGAVIFVVQDVWQFADFFWVDVIGAVVAFGGFFIIGWSNSMFRAAQTTVNPFKVKETSSMVTGGPFAFSRNPMYLGMVIHSAWLDNIHRHGCWLCTYSIVWIFYRSGADPA